MDTRLNPYFHRSEFTCACNHCDCYTVDSELLEVLTDVREFFSKPVLINSGHRCAEHNEKVGGTAMSRHLLGQAVDFFVVGIYPSVVRKYLEQKYPDKYGIGSYHNFTHLDVRKERARWEG